MPNMQTLILAGLLLLLSACATNGPKIEATRLTELRKGETTAAQIFREFGRPNFLSKNMDGSQMAVYIRSDGGNALSSATETVTFNFTPAGVLSDYKYSPPTSSRTVATPSAAPAVPSATDTANAAKPAPATAAGTTPAASTASAPAAKSSDGKSNVPYLWEILRDSAPSDPRRR
jgi:hypothetical protein